MKGKANLRCREVQAPAARVALRGGDEEHVVHIAQNRAARVDGRVQEHGDTLWSERSPDSLPQLLAGAGDERDRERITEIKGGQVPAHRRTV